MPFQDVFRPLKPAQNTRNQKGLGALGIKDVDPPGLDLFTCTYMMWWLSPCRNVIQENEETYSNCRLFENKQDTNE